MQQGGLLHWWCCDLAPIRKPLHSSHWPIRDVISSQQIEHLSVDPAGGRHSVSYGDRECGLFISPGDFLNEDILAGAQAAWEGMRASRQPQPRECRGDSGRLLRLKCGGEVRHWWPRWKSMICICCIVAVAARWRHFNWSAETQTVQTNSDDKQRLSCRNISEAACSNMITRHTFGTNQ